MNNSIHYASISVERVLLNIVMCTKAENLFDLDLDPRDTPIEWDKLRYLLKFTANFKKTHAY